jgi:hypothetical protein
MTSRSQRPPGLGDQCGLLSLKARALGSLLLSGDAAGTVADAGRAPTTEQWLRHWLEVIAARKVRPATYDGYRSKIEHHLIPGLGGHRLDRLQPEHVEEFYRGLEASGLAPATVLQIHRILSRALKVVCNAEGLPGTWQPWWTPPAPTARRFSP